MGLSKIRLESSIKQEFKNLSYDNDNADKIAKAIATVIDKNNKDIQKKIKGIEQELRHKKDI